LAAPNNLSQGYTDAKNNGMPFDQQLLIKADFVNSQRLYNICNRGLMVIRKL